MLVECHADRRRHLRFDWGAGIAAGIAYIEGESSALAHDCRRIAEHCAARRLTREEALAHARAIVDATDLPEMYVAVGAPLSMMSRSSAAYRSMRFWPEAAKAASSFWLCVMVAWAASRCSPPPASLFGSNRRSSTKASSNGPAGQRGAMRPCARSRSPGA